MSDEPLEKHNVSAQYHLEENTISLVDILLILARQIKVIIITPAIFCILMFVNVLFYTKPVYTSTAKIMSSSGGGEISQAAGLAAQFGISLPTGQSGPKWVYPEIIKSRTLARSILKRKFNTSESDAQKTLFQILTDGNDDIQLDMETLEIKAVDNFLKMVSISENIQTGIFTLSVRASDAKFAAEVNKVLIEELDAHQRKYNQSKTSETKQFIQERIIDTEKELMVAEEDLKIFRDRNRRIENSPALQLEQQRLNREVAVLTSVFTTLKQQLETIKIEEVNESSYVIILDAPEVPIRRTDPGKKRKLILAGLMGIAIGLVFAFAIEYARNIYIDDKEKMSAIKSLILKNIYELIPGKSNK